MHKMIIRFLLFAGILLMTYDLDASAKRLRCMWKADPATTMVVAWDQVSGKQPVLYYDEVDRGMDATIYSYSKKPDRVLAAKGMNNHFVRLSNLQPNTVYYFVIVDSEGVSSKYSFKTAPGNSTERLSIVAGGDSRNFRKARRNANKLVAKLNPDCVMFGGDMTGGDTAREWVDWFDDWEHTISNGRLIPIIATRGNHEYSNKTISDLFDTPNERIYYGLTLGGDLLRIYTLNSLIASGGDQKAWLHEDLDLHRHCIWKFAQYHFAIRPHTKSKSERNGQLKNWARLFYEYGVKLVMESDAHVVKVTHPVRPSREAGSDEGFIRDDVNGTVYVGEGCWGAPIRRNNDEKVWTKASGSFNQFKWIFVDQNSVEVRTIKTDNADEVGYVDKYNRFSPPAGLDVWEANGDPVTYIEKRTAVLASNKKIIPAAAPPVAKVIPSKPMQLFEFRVSDVDSKKVVNWKTLYESSKNISFEVQRSVAGQKFKTFAIVSGRGNYSEKENTYQIADSRELDQQKALVYRLKEVRSDGQLYYHKARYEKKATVTASKTNQTDVAIKTESKKNKESLTLFPDPRTGLLKVKYSLKNSGNIDIRMTDDSSNEKLKTNYINQKSGNYLKSIDMSKMPNGKYELIIKKDGALINRIAIRKEA